MTETMRRRSRAAGYTALDAAAQGRYRCGDRPGAADKPVRCRVSDADLHGHQTRGWEHDRRPVTASNSGPATPTRAPQGRAAAGEPKAAAILRATRKPPARSGGVRHLDGMALGGEAARGRPFLYEQLAVRQGRRATPPTAGSMMWSAVSVAGLLLFLALILYFQHRYRLHARRSVDSPSYRFDLARLPLTPSQRATAKYFVIVTAAASSFRRMLGGLMAHYYVDGGSFYGFDICRMLPFNIAAHLAPAVGHLLDRHRLARPGHLRRAAGERARAEAAGPAGEHSLRRPRAGGGGQHARRVALA